MRYLLLLLLIACNDPRIETNKELKAIRQELQKPKVRIVSIDTICIKDDAEFVSYRGRMSMKITCLEWAIDTAYSDQPYRATRKLSFYRWHEDMRKAVIDNQLKSEGK